MSRQPPREGAAAKTKTLNSVASAVMARAAASIGEWDLAANYYVHRRLRIMWDVIVPTERRPEGLGTTVHGRMNIRF